MLFKISLLPWNRSVIYLFRNVGGPFDLFVFREVLLSKIMSRGGVNHLLGNSEKNMKILHIFSTAGENKFTHNADGLLV